MAGSSHAAERRQRQDLTQRPLARKHRSSRDVQWKAWGRPRSSLAVGRVGLCRSVRRHNSKRLSSGTPQMPAKLLGEQHPFRSAPHTGAVGVFPLTPGCFSFLFAVTHHYQNLFTGCPAFGPPPMEVPRRWDFTSPFPQYPRQPLACRCSIDPS